MLQNPHGCCNFSSQKRQNMLHRPTILQKKHRSRPPAFQRSRSSACGCLRMLFNWLCFFFSSYKETFPFPGHADQILCHQLQMAVHIMLGGISIPCLQSCQNFGVGIMAFKAFWLCWKVRCRKFFDALTGLMVDLDQQLVPTGFDDAGVEFFVILCNGGSILFFHCFDKFLIGCVAVPTDPRAGCALPSGGQPAAPVRCAPARSPKAPFRWL